MPINKQNLKIDFLSLILMKYMIVNGTIINNASYLTKIPNDKQIKQNINERFVLCKNNAIDETNKKKYRV